VNAAIAAGLKPILCVGEKARDDEGAYLQGFSDQVLTGLADVQKNKLKMVTIAYEPVWAIGAKEAMSPNAMHEMSLYIHKLLMEPFGKPALTIPILYGGAIDEGNARPMLAEGEVQGLLVGRASADPVKFAALLKVIRAGA
jgi:triosephosphate isomerase